MHADTFDQPIRTTGRFGLPEIITSPADAYVAIRDAKFPTHVAAGMHWTLACGALDTFRHDRVRDAGYVRHFVASALWLDHLLVGN